MIRHTVDFYPRPPGGGRHEFICCHFNSSFISIHALRVEGDVTIRYPQLGVEAFLSTPSGWRATNGQGGDSVGHRFLSTPSGWRATPPGAPQIIHAVQFLSTPSGWRATNGRVNTAEGEVFLSTPSGWRATEILVLRKLLELFLSTPSGWRATLRRDPVPRRAVFLSTPSGWRATIQKLLPPSPCWYFYPRPPGGGRPYRSILSGSKVSVFLSTPSGWRATARRPAA